MVQFRRLFFLTTLAFSLKTFAYTPTEGKVSAILGPYIYKTNYNGSTTGATSPWLAGVGLIAQGDLSNKGGLEIGVFHMNKIYFREVGGNYVAEKTELVHITMGYRYWLTSYISTALAFYSAYSIGQPELLHSDFPVGAAIDTSARDTTEYGFDISLQAEVWSNQKFAVVVDARYAISVTNKENEAGDHYGGIVGLRYLIQEKMTDTKKAKK